MDIRVGIGRKDLKRLLGLVELEDKSFFVLALNAIVERELSLIAKQKYDSSIDVREPYPSLYSQFENIRADLSERQKDIFKRLKRDRAMADDVRHGFEEMAVEDILLATNDFFVFMDMFSEHLKTTDEYKELKNAVREIPNRNAKRMEIERRRFLQLQGKVVAVGSSQLNYNAIHDGHADISGRKRDVRHKMEVERMEFQYLSDDLNGRIKALNRKKKRLLEIRNRTENDEKELMDVETTVKGFKSELEKRREGHDIEIERLKASKADLDHRSEKADDIMEGIQSMRRLLAYTGNKLAAQKDSMVLTPAQKEIVDSVREGADFLIKGGAGSGKTLVLLELLKRTHSDLRHSSCHLLTYTKTLKYFSETSLAPLMEADMMDFSTVDSLLLKMTRGVFQKGIVFSKGEDDRMEYYNGIVDDKDCLDEIELFIWPKGVTKEEYVDDVCPREGMKERIGAERRRYIWEVKEKAEKLLEKKDKWPSGYAVLRLLDELERNPEAFRYYRKNYYFVDECQDLHLSTLKLIKRLSNTAVYLAGDVNQSIFRKARYRLKDAGIDVGGRTKILSECHRGTVQINDVCERYRKEACIEGTGQDMKSSREGLPVFVQRIAPKKSPKEGKQEEQGISMICKAVSTLLELDVDIDDICVLTYTNGQAKSIRTALVNRKIAAETLNRDVIDNEGCKTEREDVRNLLESNAVKVMTVFGAKGLEFPVVLLYGCEKVFFADGLDEDEIETLKRNIVYVAATRAVSYLGVFIDAEVPSKALELLEKVVSEANERFPSPNDIPF